MIGFSGFLHSDLANDINPRAFKYCKNVDMERLEKAILHKDNDLGWSALNYAIDTRDYQSAIILCDYTVDINRRDGLYASNPQSGYKVNALERVLYIAQFANRQKVLEKDQVLLIEKLLDCGIECNTSINTGLKYPVLYLCYFNEIELVGRLLDLGVEINTGDGRLLSLAFSAGHVQLVDYLIKRGADTGLVNMLEGAILGQKIELIQFALDNGSEINSIDTLSLALNYTWAEVRNMYANPDCGIPSLDIVNFLLSNGADPNLWIQDALDKEQNLNEAFGRSPLGKAQRLLDNTANFHQKYYQQCLVNMLLDFGAIRPKVKG